MRYIIIQLGMIAIFGTVIQKLSDKIDRISSTSRLALYGTYCNNYRNRALHHFTIHGNWDGYVVFSPVCNLQDAAEVWDSIKYRDWNPKNSPRHSYDTFFTGKGHDGDTVDKAIINREKKLNAEIKEMLKKNEK